MRICRMVSVETPVILAISACGTERLRRACMIASCSSYAATRAAWARSIRSRSAFIAVVRNAPGGCVGVRHTGSLRRGRFTSLAGRVLVASAAADRRQLAGVSSTA